MQVAIQWRTEPGWGVKEEELALPKLRVLAQNPTGSKSYEFESNLLGHY